MKKDVKINSNYYQKYILAFIFKEKIPLLYPNNLHCVKFHENKASSHISKSTALFWEKTRDEIGIEAIPFKCIPPKTPDVSFMDSYAFGLLHDIQRLWMDYGRLWRRSREKINLDSLKNSFLSWKTRCNMILQQKWYQTEHIRKWNSYIYYAYIRIFNKNIALQNRGKNLWTSSVVWCGIYSTFSYPAL